MERFVFAAISNFVIKNDSWTTITCTVPILYVRLVKMKNYDAQMVTTQVIHRYMLI